MFSWYVIVIVGAVFFLLGIGLTLLLLANEPDLIFIKKDEVIMKKSDVIKLQKAMRLVISRIDPEFLSEEKNED